MSPAAEKVDTKTKSMDGKEFEETFKPKKGAIPEKLEDDKKTKKKKKDKKDKKKPGFIKILIIVGIILALFAGSGAALYFSGILTPILNTVGIHLPAVVQEGPSIKEQQAALDQRKAELDVKEEELNKLKEKLDAQQAALDAAAQETEVAGSTFEGILAGFSEEKLSELKQVGAIYSKMDPAAAAAIMTKIYETEQIAVIVYYMQPAASALVLAKLDPGLAANVTSMLTS